MNNEEYQVLFKDLNGFFYVQTKCNQMLKRYQNSKNLLNTSNPDNLTNTSSFYI